MSSQVDRSPSQPLYVTWMLLFLAGLTILQMGVVVGVYYLLYGAPTPSDWTTQQVPIYSTTVLWQGRIWYPVLKTGPGLPGSQATLRSVDPEKGEMSESKLKIPFPSTGFVAQGDRLWSVSTSVVTRIEGEVATEFKPRYFLHRPCEPFFYSDQLAVIDNRKNGSFMLLVFQDDDWVEIGNVKIPSNYTNALAEGKKTLVPLPSTTTSVAALLDLQVIAHQGRFHLFLSDGIVVAYRDGLDLDPISALAPANVSSVPDVSHLPDWEVVCQVYPGIAMRGKRTWRATLDEGQPAVLSTWSSSRNPFQAATLQAYRQANGSWTKITETSIPAPMELVAVWDDERSYVAGVSLMQTLRFLRLKDHALTETSAVLKAPQPPFQSQLTRWARIYQWAFWIGLLIMALGVSRLMRNYRDTEYEFGLTTVELASVTRRYVSRAIDSVICLSPLYLIALCFGLANQENVEKNMDKIFDMGQEGLFKRLILYSMTCLIYVLVVLIVTSWLEGRWGITLGKWICGVRTVRTTLRPCGFARAMVREILLVVETLFNSVFIPVTLIIAFTECRQRIGDLVADTIVIRKIRNAAVSETKTGFE